MLTKAVSERCPASTLTRHNIGAEKFAGHSNKESRVKLTLMTIKMMKK